MATGESIGALDWVRVLFEESVRPRFTLAKWEHVIANRRSSSSEPQGGKHDKGESIRVLDSRGVVFIVSSVSGSSVVFGLRACAFGKHWKKLRTEIHTSPPYAQPVLERKSTASHPHLRSPVRKPKRYLPCENPRRGQTPEPQNFKTS
eukprot:6469109-Amphidinium_carterae.2